MHSTQDVTYAVVLPQPDGGIHDEAGHQAERLVAHGQALLLRHVGGVVHLCAHAGHCRGVHLSVDVLGEKQRKGVVVSKPCHEDDDDEDDVYLRHGWCLDQVCSSFPYLIL